MSQLIKNNIAKLYQSIRQAEEKYGRPSGSVGLLAVSKTRPATDIASAVEAGISDIGENYLTEALEKIQHASLLPQQADNATKRPVWHFIGPIQSNKTRAIAEHFDWVHSVDRLKIAQRLSAQRPAKLPPLQVCIQLNSSGEASKSGIAADQLEALAASIADLPKLQLRGIMGLPQRCDGFALQRQACADIYGEYAALKQHYPAIDTLSMGMSGDMEAAIAEGSNMVRIGTALFGPRDSTA